MIESSGERLEIRILVTDVNVKGGVETMAKSLLSEFLKQGHSVQLISLCSRGQNQNGVIHLGVEKPRSLWGRLWFRKKNNKLIEGYLKGCDILIGNSSFRFLLTPQKNASYKQVELFHTSYSERLVVMKGFLKRLKLKAVLYLRNQRYKNLDELIVLTKENMDCFKLAGVKNVSVIPNALNPCQNLISAEGAVQKLLFVGRLDSLKGLDYLLDGWKTLSARHRHLCLDIYGSGVDLAYLKNRILKEEIKAVELKGVVDDVQGIMTEYDLLLFPSLWEGFPMVVLEALNVGLPVVAFDCKTGPRDIITSGEDGFVVPLRNTKVFVEKVEYFIENPILWQSASKQAKLNIQRFHWVNIIPMWLKLFERIKGG